MRRLLFTLVSLIFASQAYASRIKDNALYWYYNPTNAPAWLSQDAAIRSITASFAKWGSCGVAFRYLGIAQDMTATRGRWTIGWKPSWESWPAGEAKSIAERNTGKFLGGGILLTPSVLKEVGVLDRVLTHEIGHLLGLGHAWNDDDPASIMFQQERKEVSTPSATDLAKCR